MAVSFGFYDSLNGDRKYTAVQFSYLFNSLIKDGIFMHVGEHLNVKEGTGMQVNVGSGFAWFNSTWTRNDADYPLTITASDLLQVRIDAIVLEVDETISSRTNSIKVITGTPSSNPQKPTLTNTNDIHQYPLAYVTVGVGVTSITQANIENCIGTDPCPFVTGVLDTIDATTLIAQWEAQFNEWFESLEDTLSGDVAGNLLNKINDLDEKTDLITQSVQKVRENGTFHYRALFKVSNWSGSGPYTQTSNLVTSDGGPVVTPSSVFDSGATTDKTSNETTNEALMESLNMINKGPMILGNNQLTCAPFEKPTTDLWVHVLIKTALKDMMILSKNPGDYATCGNSTDAGENRRYTKTNSSTVVMFPYTNNNGYVGWAIMGRTQSDTNGSGSGLSFSNNYPMTLNGRSCNILAITSGEFKPGIVEFGTVGGPIYQYNSSQNLGYFYDISDTFTNSENPILKEAEQMLHDAGA